MTDEIQITISQEEATNVVGSKEALQKLLEEKKKGFALAPIRRISLMTLGEGVDLKFSVSGLFLSVQTEIMRVNASEPSWESRCIIKDSFDGVSGSAARYLARMGTFLDNLHRDPSPSFLFRKRISHQRKNWDCQSKKRL